MILLTGGSGTLGTELRKLFKERKDFIAITERYKLDLTFPWPNTIHSYIPESIARHLTLIIHCAAYTNVLKAESEKKLCYQTNVIGTRNLASLGIPMLYISTEYVFDGEKGDYNETDYPNPINFYALTKLLGEYESRRTRSVILRCLFKPRPFEHERACTNQFTTGDYVEVMAKEIALAVSLFDSLPPTVHIGSEKKSTFELARRTRPEVQPCKVEEIPVKLPKDTSLNTDLWRNIKNEHSLRKV